MSESVRRDKEDRLKTIATTENVYFVRAKGVPSPESIVLLVRFSELYECQPLSSGKFSLPSLFRVLSYMNIFFLYLLTYCSCLYVLHYFQVCTLFLCFPFYIPSWDVRSAVVLLLLLVCLFQLSSPQFSSLSSLPAVECTKERKTKAVLHPPPTSRSQFNKTFTSV